MNHQSGFTIAEFLIASTLLIVVGMFAFSQWQYADMNSRDTERKTAINAVHFYLTEVYLPKHKSFPVTLRSQSLDNFDARYLRDPSGHLVADPASSLRYEPSGCTGTTCKRYVLRADLEKEADFIRTASASR